MALPGPSPGAELPQGTRLLDRYVVRDRIGAGGMATIHRAHDERLDRTVCVKLMRRLVVDGADGGQAAERALDEASYRHFVKEALALSRLAHPNTLRIYDFGHLGAREGGAPFHVCEYLDGGTLEAHVRARGALPVTEALDTLARIADALAEAHGQGILHRDIKPSNILFARVGAALVPKLADFGIAHGDLRRRDAAQAPADDPRSSVALFSPRWAAPEQLRGAPEDATTDVYALALVAAYALTGRMLFGDDDVRVTFVERVRGDDLVRTRLAQAGAGGPGADVLVRALAVRPDARPATAPAFVAELRDALAAAAAPPPAPEDDLPTHRFERATVARPRPEAHAPVLRYVAVDEAIDLTVPSPGGTAAARVRVIRLPGPSRPGAPRLTVKGLSCFVQRPGERPAPAITADRDGRVELVSAGRQVQGHVDWWLGDPADGGARAFLVEGRRVLVPSAYVDPIALRLDGADEIVVIHRATGPAPRAETA